MAPPNGGAPRRTQVRARGETTHERLANRAEAVVWRAEWIVKFTTQQLRAAKRAREAAYRALAAERQRRALVARGSQ